MEEAVAVNRTLWRRNDDDEWPDNESLMERASMKGQ